MMAYFLLIILPIAQMGAYPQISSVSLLYPTKHTCLDALKIYKEQHPDWQGNVNIWECVPVGFTDPELTKKDNGV